MYKIKHKTKNEYYKIEKIYKDYVKYVSEFYCLEYLCGSFKDTSIQKLLFINKYYYIESIKNNNRMIYKINFINTILDYLRGELI